MRGINEEKCQRVATEIFRMAVRQLNAAHVNLGEAAIIIETVYENLKDTIREQDQPGVGN